MKGALTNTNPLKRLGHVLGLVVFVVALLLSFGSSAQAQTTPRDEALAKCKTNPASCQSYDPEVNPILIFEGAKYASGWSNERAPEVTADGECKRYSVSFVGNVTGCIKEGVFSFNGTITAGGAAGGVATTEATVSSDGNVETTSKTGDSLVGAAGSLIGTASDAILKPIAIIVLTLSGWILGLVGVFFNQVVIKTVFQFSTYFGTSDGMLIAWGVIRDISNIGLLFGFIFMGVLLILDVGGGGHGHGHGGGISAKRAIPRLIIFAVLLNFSLFASQAVIDVSNALASSLATLAGQSCTDAAQTANCANVGISGKVLQLAGVGTLWNESIIEGLRTNSVIILGLSLFVIITAVVLLAAGIMLVIRVVVLTLLMVTSPIGFAGMVIPGLQGAANKWWHALISQSFFAPVMLLLVFVSLKVAEGLNPNGQPLVKAFAGNNTTIAGNLEVLVVFAVVIGLMIASLIVASRLGAMGASFATNAASAVSFGALTRGTNFAVGGGANYLRTRIQSSNFGKTGVGQVLVNRGLRPLENANLDLRRLPGVGGALKAGGVSAGAQAAGHATYADIAHQFSDIKSGKASNALKEQYEAEVNVGSIESKHGHNLTATDKANLKKMGAKELAKMHVIQEGVEETIGELENAQFDKLMKEKDLLTDDQKGAVKKGRLAALVTKASAGTLTSEQFDKAMKNDAFNGTDKDSLKAAQITALGNTIGTLTAEQFEKTVKSEHFNDADKQSLRASRVAAIQGTVAAMTVDQFEANLKGDAFDDASKQALKAARYNDLVTAITTGNAPLVAQLTKQLNKKDLEHVPNTAVMSQAFTDALSDKQREDFISLTNRTNAEKEAVQNSYTYAKINNVFKASGNAAAIAPQVAALNPEQIAKLDSKILTSPEVTAVFTPVILKTLQDDKKLSVAERAQIGDSIRNNDTLMADPRMKTYMEGQAGVMW